ncbi:MAG TPA: type II toxin-antitoxin system HicB family antitoxin, partial [Candidatus Angelobacter sp.]
MKYFVLYAPTEHGYSAHVPDLPGCVAAAATLQETRQLMKEAIEFHLEG